MAEKVKVKLELELETNNSKILTNPLTALSEIFHRELAGQFRLGADYATSKIMREIKSAAGTFYWANECSVCVYIWPSDYSATRAEGFGNTC